MSNVQLFFLLLYTSGVMIISYKNYAIKNGWPIGRFFQSDSNVLKLIGLLAIFGSTITAFFFIKWYFVIIGLLVGWILSANISNLLKKHAQILSIVMFLLSWIFLIIN